MRPLPLSAIVAASLLASSTVAHAEAGTATFEAPGIRERVSFFGVGPRGFLTSPELDLLSQLMRCRRTGRMRRIDPTLARALITVARHYGRTVVVVSGYRARVLHGRRRSHHLSGRAADFYVHGVPPVEVRDYLVSQGATGIGFYPNSGFVHLDVRERPYYWVDYSGPGQRGRLIPDPTGTAPVLPESHRPMRATR